MATTLLKLPEDMPRRVGNCGVVAVCLLAGVTHAEACQALGINPNIAGDGSKKTRRKSNPYSTYQNQRVAALRKLGFNVEQLVMYYDGQKRHRLKWWAERLPRGVNYMVRVHKHAVVIRDGLVYDQNNVGKPVDLHFSCNQIVTDIAHIV